MNKLLLALVALVTVTGMQNVSAGDLYKEVDVVVTEPISWPARTPQEEMDGARPVALGKLYSTSECAGGTCEVYESAHIPALEFQNGKKLTARYKAIALDDDNKPAPAGSSFVGSFKLERNQGRDDAGQRLGLHRLK